MKKAKTKVMADNFNGIFTVENYDQECKVLSQQDFIESLRGLGMGELIGTELDRNKFREIKEEYGIQS